MEEILFICTGNYYRSRFCEIMFNHLAPSHGLDKRAFSRGLRVLDSKPHNPGPISKFTLAYLNKLQILPQQDFRFPQQIEEADFLSAQMIIALDKEEHYPMMQELYPTWQDKIEYWSFPDNYIIPADEILPRLELQVKSMMAAL